jgi:C_GCAxxG_C_C family probable redox protein
MQNREKMAQMGERAERYYKDGYCCSEAILKAAIDIFSIDISSDMVRHASGFCGGMGNREGPCGVFSGGIMVLRSLVERTGSRNDDRLLRDLSSTYTEKVKGEAKGVVCNDILGKMGIVNRLGKRGCRKITRRGAEILAEIILEHERTGRSAQGAIPAG